MNIAMAGYSRSGKSKAAKAIAKQNDYALCSFSTIIKEDLDPLIMQFCGFSAFTEIDEQKTQIRGLLEQYGEAAYDSIIRRYFDRVDRFNEDGYSVVNERIVRIREAKEWVDRGGVIWEIYRPGYDAATAWEREALYDLQESGYISHQIINAGTVEQLHKMVRHTAGLVDV